jgi:RHS repeat-associated protein
LSGLSSPFGFQGAYTDPNGFLYLIDRYYDPVTDQFLSVDPDVADSGQPYAFTGDDPLNGTDPLGLYVSGGGGTSDECNTSASGTIYCTGGNGNGVSAAGSYNPSTGARTGAFVPSTEASDEVANEAAMAAQATTENEATAMTAETGGGSLKSPLAGCEQRYAASYCETLSPSAQEGLYCGELASGMCLQYAADLQASKEFAAMCASGENSGEYVYVDGAYIAGGGISISALGFLTGAEGIETGGAIIFIGGVVIVIGGLLGQVSTGIECS